MVLILLIAAFLGALASFAVVIFIAPTYAVFALMVGGAITLACAASWMVHVKRRRAARAASVAEPPVGPNVKPDLISLP